MISRLCAGDPAAWVQLLDHWSPYLYSYVLYNVNNDAEARRVVRLILSDVIHTLASSHRIVSLTILIFSIAYQHVLRYRRHFSDHAPVGQHAVDQETGDHPAQPARFYRLFRQCTLEVQQVLLLYYLCGVTLWELAQIVEQSEETVTKIVDRARSYFR
ncbi:MAG: sigma-70 family RNA polymerase sigma factor [Caldilineaceae bacterium]|nr:sigma-70 family RNA polymerase sigma factor [Caldilineaceae bacterium]